MVKFGRVAPQFGVKDIQKAIDFWVEALGFEVTFANGNPVCFSVLKKDDSEIHIKLDPERAGKGHCHILVEGLDDFFKAYQATGHKVIQPPKLQSWGMKDAVLADSDGNTVEVAERIVSPLS